jgi:hypothetical protein
VALARWAESPSRTREVVGTGGEGEEEPDWRAKSEVGTVNKQNGARRSDTEVGLTIRFRTLVFWVYEPLDSLRPRLSRRVDKMVDNGLLREIAELRAIAEDLYGSADEADHTEGIFQSIGRSLTAVRKS